jgi:hypothetical protein
MSFLADLVALFHLLFVLFVALGLLAILAGGALRWRWVRWWKWRMVHLVAISYVGIQTLLGFPCPITELEFALREAGGEVGDDRSFIQRMAHAVLFGDLPQWAYPVMHVGVTLAVCLAMFLVPPQFRAMRPDPK